MRSAPGGLNRCVMAASGDITGPYGYVGCPRLPSLWEIMFVNEQLRGLPLAPGSGWVLSSGCFSPPGIWLLRLGVWCGVHSQHQSWLLMCGAGGDAGCDAGLVGALDAPLWRVGALSWCRCTWVWCCAGGLPAGRCRLFCIVFPVLCMCAATYSVHAL